MGERIQTVITSPLCYSIMSHTTIILQCSRIRINTTKPRHITFTLVATCVILRSLKCNLIMMWTSEYDGGDVCAPRHQMERAKLGQKMSQNNA